MLALRLNMWQARTLALCALACAAPLPALAARSSDDSRVYRSEFAPATEDFDSAPGGYPAASSVSRSIEQVIVPSPEPAPETAPDPLVESPPVFEGDVVITDDQPQGFWRYVPEGMIPVIGPRTPASRRYRPIGQPLIGTSWLDNPLSLSLFAGGAEGTPLVRDQIIQDNIGVFAGFGGGIDYDYYWGIEKRLNYASLQIANVDHTQKRVAEAFYGEYRLMYYPLGDTRWRPFVFTGPGLVDFFYRDNSGDSLHRTQFMIPFGLGLKYMWTPHWVTRVEILDDYSIGTWGMSSMHNVSINFGLEARFGMQYHWWHLFQKHVMKR